jgi:hypothetical protein
MKQLLNFQPVFDPENKTLDFSQWPEFQVHKLYAVINVTRNTPIYVPGTTKYGISSVNDKIITLEFDTTTYETSDKLSVYYDANSEEGNYALEHGGNLSAINETMARLLKEVMVTNYIFSHGLNIKKDDVDAIRNDLFKISNNISTD